MRRDCDVYFFFFFFFFGGGGGGGRRGLYFLFLAFRPYYTDYSCPRRGLSFTFKWSCRLSRSLRLNFKGKH